jgi:murein DD-endopeptidase MepM/ murein hydrolase activator NlpD
MASFASAFNSGLTIRLLMIGCCAGLLAGCADSQRLTDPFSDPFRGDVDHTPTGSISEPQPYAPTQPVESRPLTPPPAASYSAPAYTSPHVASGGWSGSDTASRSVHPSTAGWTAEGGMPVVVAQGETAEVIARRYGIPTDALVHANGYSYAGQIRPGARIVIPTYNAALAASSGVRLSTARNEERRAQERIHEARIRDTHLHFVRGPAPAEDRHARAAEIKAEKRAEKLAREKHAPGAPLASARTIKQHARPEADAAPVAHVYAHATPAPIDHMPTASLEPAADQPADAAPEFRWPARGRITEGYRRGVNDGINIALPEGTSVKAAEAGLVVYAGNEVRGYGNLVLIRHPNGFVTAYADNGELNVKRGETVRRGQVIAKSGETGNATSPQLHFEVRKGSTPVDPTQYLAGL